MPRVCLSLAFSRRLPTQQKLSDFTLIWFMISDCLINCLQFLLIPSHALASCARLISCVFWPLRMRTRRCDAQAQEETKKSRANTKLNARKKRQEKAPKERRPWMILLSWNRNFTLRFHVQLKFSSHWKRLRSLSWFSLHDRGLGQIW